MTVALQNVMLAKHLILSRQLTRGLGQTSRRPGDVSIYVVVDPCRPRNVIAPNGIRHELEVRKGIG